MTITFLEGKQFSNCLSSFILMISNRPLSFHKSKYRNRKERQVGEKTKKIFKSTLRHIEISEVPIRYPGKIFHNQIEMQVSQTRKKARVKRKTFGNYQQIKHSQRHKPKLTSSMCYRAFQITSKSPSHYIGNKSEIAGANFNQYSTMDKILK